jgi:hypothetical protein
MKTLIQKELREIAVWAGAGALLMIAVMALFIYQALNIGYSVTWLESADQLFNTYSSWMMIGAPLIALGIGVLQILPEMARDQWAFLIHRPLTLRQIWVAKVTAGVGCYLLATIIPLAGTTIWLSRPGNFPGPFDVRLALPGLSSIAAGLFFYFAGQIVVLRHARWYGSKLLPLFAAAIWVPLSLSAFIFLPLGVVMLAVVSEGAFRRQGEYSGLTLIQRIMLGATMAAGSLTVVGIAVGFTLVIWHDIHPRVTNFNTSASNCFVLTKSGEPVLIDFPHGTGEISRILKVMDIHGNDIYGASLNQSDYLFPNTIIPWSPGPSYSGYESYYRTLTSSTLYSGQTQQSSEIARFYSMRDRVIYLYSTSDYRPQGYVGVDGLVRKDRGSAPKFPIGQLFLDVNRPDMLQFPTAVYKVSFANYPNISSKLVLTPPLGEHFRAITYEFFNSNAPIEALTERSMLIYSGHGVLLSSEPLFANTMPDAMYSVLRGAASKKVYVINGNADVDYDEASGKPPLANKLTFTSNGDFVNVRVTRLGDQHLDSLASLWPMVFAPMAPVVVISALLSAAAHDFSAWSLANAFIPKIACWVLVGSLIALCVMVPLSRRYGAKGTRIIPWLICGLTMGIGGILMILAMRPLPVQIICPSCGKKRGVDTVACEHCGHGLDALIPDGREIFEDPNLNPSHLASIS